METVDKICIVGILILSLCCFVEELATYRFRFEGGRSRFRMFAFLAIGIMSAVLFADYFFLK